MTINGVHIDEKVVVGMTRKQFVAHAKHGSPHLKEKNLEDMYDQAVKAENANNSKPPTSGTADGPK